MIQILSEFARLSQELHNQKQIVIAKDNEIKELKKELLNSRVSNKEFQSIIRMTGSTNSNLVDDLKKAESALIKLGMAKSPYYTREAKPSPIKSVINLPPSKPCEFQAVLNEFMPEKQKITDGQLAVKHQSLRLKHDKLSIQHVDLLSENNTLKNKNDYYMGALEAENEIVAKLKKDVKKLKAKLKNIVSMRS